MLNTGQSEKLSFEEDGIFISVHLYVVESFFAPFYFNFVIRNELALMKHWLQQVVLNVEKLPL